MTIVAINKRTQCEDRFHEARHGGASPLQADIIAKRIPNSNLRSSEILSSSLESLNASDIKDLDKTANRLVKALRRGEQIALLSDFNISSLASAALIDKSLVDFFNYDGSKVKTYISNSSRSKSGLSSDLLSRVFENRPKPTLIICVGMMAANLHATRQMLDIAKKEGTVLDFVWCGNSKVITDKNKSFYTMINPQQETCESEDKEIGDTALSVLLMTRLRKRLLETKILTSAPKMGHIIPMAACCHMQHSTSLMSPTNRSLVRQAYLLMMNPNLPIWKAFRRTFLTPFQPINSQEISKFLVDVVDTHARRSGNPYDVIKFLRSDDEMEALRYLKLLTSSDNLDQSLERSLVKAAMFSASRLVQEGRKALFIYLPKAAPELQLKIAETVQSKYSLPCCIVMPEGYSHTEIDLSELAELDVNPFKGMKIKENIQLKGGSKQIKTYLESYHPDRNPEIDYMMVASKEKKEALPTFTLYSLDPYEFIAELDYKVAAKISTKNVFQGIKKGVHSFQIPNGELVFDLDKVKSPNLYIRRPTSGRGVATNYKSALAIDVLNAMHSNVDTLASDDSVSFNIALDDIEKASSGFEKAWGKIIKEKHLSLGVIIKSDGRTKTQRVLNFTTIDEIKALEPFGKGFEYPVYEIVARCTSFIQSGNHLTLKLEVDGIPYNAIWNDFYTSAWVDSFTPNKTYTLLVEPRDNYKDDKRLLLPHVVAII